MAGARRRASAKLSRMAFSVSPRWPAACHSPKLAGTAAKPAACAMACASQLSGAGRAVKQRGPGQFGPGQLARAPELQIGDHGAGGVQRRAVAGDGVEVGLVVMRQLLRRAQGGEIAGDIADRGAAQRDQQIRHAGVKPVHGDMQRGDIPGFTRRMGAGQQRLQDLCVDGGEVDDLHAVLQSGLGQGAARQHDQQGCGAIKADHQQARQVGRAIPAADGDQPQAARRQAPGRKAVQGFLFADLQIAGRRQGRM